MPLFKRREEAPNLAQLRQECREFIRQLPLTDPDEDWIPSAIYYGVEGPGVVAFDLDPPDLTDALEELFDEATTYGFWAPTWMVHADDVDKAPGVRPAEHPYRFEALVLQLQAEGERALDCAPIERHETGPPTLGEWEILEEGEPLP